MQFPLVPECTKKPTNTKRRIPQPREAKNFAALSFDLGVSIRMIQPKAIN